ncbi:hypothetical protein ACD933_23830 [Escherichia coli]
MEVLNAPGKYQYDLRNHLLVDLFPIALDAEITTSNVNKHQLHRSNIPATLSGNSGITGYVPFSAERNAARVIWRTATDSRPVVCNDEEGIPGVKWFTEFGHLNRGDMLTSEQHRCHNEKKKFQRRV